MRELVYYIAVSADGFIASPTGGFEAFPVQGDHIDMILRDYKDTLPAAGLKALGLTADYSRFDTVLMGWNTYAVGLSQGVGDPYPHLRQYVFSRSHTAAAGDLKVTAEDPVAIVRALKAEARGTGIWLCGGGQLASVLIDQIDRFIFKVNPLLLGAGVPLFATRGYLPQAIELEKSTAYRSGVVINEYRRRGNTDK